METYSYNIWRAWYNGSHTMMAKPITALELCYLLIQFLMRYPMIPYFKKKQCYFTTDYDRWLEMTNLDHSISEEPTIPPWDFRIQWFIWRTMNQETWNHLFWSESSQWNSALVFVMYAVDMSHPAFIFSLLLDCSSYLSQENYRIEELRINWINIWNSSVVLVWSRNTILVSWATLIILVFVIIIIVYVLIVFL